jgi:hypothetical protein
LVYEIGSLPDARWLTLDALNPSTVDIALTLELYERGGGPPCVCRFTLMPQAQARLRFDLSAVDQNRWLYPREGACLKPTMSGARVTLSEVDRIEVKVLYKAVGRVRWCMTPLRATATQPPVLENPQLPAGPLLDELGQATYRDWPSRTSDVDTMVAR